MTERSEYTVFDMVLGTHDDIEQVTLLITGSGPGATTQEAAAELGLYDHTWVAYTWLDNDEGERQERYNPLEHVDPAGVGAEPITEDGHVYGDDLPCPDDYAAEAPMPGDRW